MKLVNLTPHAITLRSPDGTDHTIPPSGTVARVSQTPGTPSTIEGVPVPVYSTPATGEVEGLPAPDPRFVGCFQADTMYVVSALVGLACKGRSDVVMPGTGPADGAIRETDGPRKGQIIAVTRLVRV